MLSIFQQHPKDKKAIGLQVKQDADWRCEVCDKKCRRPGEPFDTNCRTLTLAFRNHNSFDFKRENLVAMCVPCHLDHDAIRQRRVDIMRGICGKKETQLSLFPYNSLMELLE